MRFRPLLLLALWLVAAPALAEEIPLGAVTGRVEMPGIERYRGIAALWDGRDGRVPDPRRYVIIPFSVAPLDAEGRFELKAPAGPYYLGAIVRTTPGPDVGPPRRGDLIFMSPDSAGDAVRVEVRAEQLLDVGTHSKGWAYEGFAEGVGTGIAGQVVDPSGVPVAGVLVFAFADPEMSKQPIAVSERTDSEGRYLLRLSGASRVYLRVKDNYGGGAPADGGHIGVYGGQVAKVVEVAGEQLVEGIGITAIKLPAIRNRRGDRPGPPTERGPGEELPGSQPRQ